MLAPERPQSRFPFTTGSSGIRVSEIVRPLLGAQRSVLVKCTDGYYYTIDHPTSLPDERTLVGLQLGPALAKSFGFPIAQSTVVLVDAPLAIQQNQCAGSGSVGPALIKVGLYCANKLVGSISGDNWAIPHLSRHRWSFVVNRNDFVGVYLLGVWSGCSEQPMAMFLRSENTGEMRAIFTGMDRLFVDLDYTQAALIPQSHIRRDIPYSDLCTEKAIGEWLANMQQRAPNLLKAVFSQLTQSFPSFDPIGLHAALLNRLEQMCHQSQSRLDLRGANSYHKDA